MPSSADRSPPHSSNLALSMSPSFATSPPTSTVQWIPNHLAAHCLSCYEDFSFLRRRHHCRRCGLIFCEQCSSKRVQLQPAAQPVRVCDKCHAIVRQETRTAAKQTSTAAANTHSKSNNHTGSASTNHPRLSHSVTAHSLAQHHHTLRAPSPTVTVPAPATHHQRSRTAAEQYWDAHVRIDDAEHIKLHLGEVILLVGRIEQLDGMSEEDIVRRVRDRRERWRDDNVREERRERDEERKAQHNHSRTWTGPALKAIPPPSLSAGSSPQPQPHKQQPQSSRPSISSSASSSVSASPTHLSNASISKSNSHHSIASLFVSTAARTADSSSTPSSTASASPTPQPASSPSRSPMVVRPYIEDELSLDDSPVIVELRRRNSTSETAAGVGGRDDPLARYGDRMIVKERQRERVKRDDRESRPSRQGKLAAVSHNPFYPGHLIISNYQLAFIPTHVITPSSATTFSSSPFHPSPLPLLPVVQLPLLAISRLSSATIEQKDLAVVELRCKDFRRLHVLFTGLARKNRWYGYQQCCDVLKFYAQPKAEDGFASVFAFKFRGTKQPRRSAGSETTEADAAGGGVSGQRLHRQGSVLLPVRHSVTPSHVMVRDVAVAALPSRSKSAFVPKETVEPMGGLYGKKDDETDDEADANNEQNFTLNLLAADAATDGLGQQTVATIREIASSDEESDEEQEEGETDGTAGNTTLVHNSSATVNGISVDTSLPVTNPLSPPLTLAPSYSFRSVDEGWDVYDAYAEYARMGVPSRHWRITSINASYSFCSSYPSVLVVPKQTSDSDLLLARSFRSRHRLPVFVWRRRTEGDEGRGPVLLRSSQPMVGIMSARSTDDELLLSHAVSSTPSRSLVIVDARPLANARANVALGAGTEVAENYTSGGVDCSVVWLGVENIHTVRKSYKALWKLVVRMVEEEVAVGAVVGGVVGGAMMDFWPDFIATQHFTLLSSLLAGGQFIASTLASSSVLLHCRSAATRIPHSCSLALVHCMHSLTRFHPFAGCLCCYRCSDGWDRTPQLSSLACLLLDAHYRTLDGFIALIELHFLSFGHKFTHRTGVGLTHVKGEESPIFHQWLDCVYQLLSQHPAAFEFDERLLMFLLDSLYDGRYGTWLGNSEAERVKAGVSVRSHSVWTPVLADRQRWMAADYRRLDGVLSVDVRMMRFWRSYYMRYDWMRLARSSWTKDGTGTGRLLMGSGGGGVVSDVEVQVRCCVLELVGEVCSAFELDERRRLQQRLVQLETIVSKLLAVQQNGERTMLVNGTGQVGPVLGSAG